MENIMTNELANIGIVGIALLFIIRELFSFLKSRKNGMIGENGSVNKQLLEAIQSQNNNHLHTLQETIDTICKDINLGNDRVVKAITDMHTDLAGKIGIIRGKIDK